MSRSRTASVEFQARREEQERAAAEARRAARIALKAQAARDRERYVADRVADADRYTRRLDERVGELRTVLARGLRRSPRTDPALLHRTLELPPLDLGGIGWRPAPPDWSRFVPPQPAPLRRLLGGRARYRRQLAEARAGFERAREEHERAEAERQRRFAGARRRYAARIAAERRAVAEHNRAADALVAALRAREPGAVRRHLDSVLAAVPLPRDFPRAAEVACAGDTAVARVELPTPDVVPVTRAVRYDPAEDELRELLRPAEEVAELYRLVTGQVALLCVRDLLVADPGLGSVTVHGQVRGTRVLSLHADRAGFERLDLGDVEGCLHRLAAPGRAA